MIIKLALNSFTKNWQSLSNVAKQTIGRSGAIRPERQFLMGHIAGNENILQNMKNHGINIRHLQSTIVAQPGGMPESTKSGILINMKNALEKTRSVLPAIGINPKILPKDTSKSGRYFASQLQRHEMREIDTGIKKLKQLPSKDRLESGIPNIIKFIQNDPQHPHIGRKIKAFGKYVGKHPEFMDLEQGKFLGHHSKSIPMADIKQSKSLPNQLGKPMYDMRMKEFNYK